MVVDTSAIVAILTPDPDGTRFAEAIAGAAERCISTLTLYECRIVLGRKGGTFMLHRLDELIGDVELAVASFDQEQADLAYEAYRRFGRGSGHAARLNLGDCAAYALAMSRNLPLLFKGGDFALTDVTPALRQD